MADTDDKDAGNARKFPDGGWGWMVAAGCSIILFLMPLMTLCFSILFFGFLLEQEATSTATAWIFNTHTLLWNIIGPFIGPLTKEFGYRSVVIFGAIMAASCMLACAFSTSILYLLVFFSLAGLFGGMTCKPCYLIIPIYFDKRRGLANAIIMGGMCTGQFVVPPVIRFLQQNFGFTGATMIVSSLLLNCCIGASFFHPVEWHLKKTADPKLTEVVFTEKHITASEKHIEKTSFSVDGKDTVQSLIQKESRSDVKSRRRQISECSYMSSIVDISGVSPYPDDDTMSNVVSEPGSKEGARNLLIRVVLALISDLKILRFHRAQIIAVGGLFFINGYLNFLMTVPFAVQAAGYSPEDAAWCISITGICNFIARLSSSLLSDYSWFNMRLMYMAGSCIVGASTIVFSFLTNLTLMKVTLGVWAYGIGVNISLYVLVMARIMGVENMAAIFGTQSLLVGLGYVVLGPLIGLIRDMSGSYAVSMWVMSAEIWLCVLLWVFMPAAIARDKSRLEKEQNDSSRP
ncbi:hypothetical protein SK128_026023 [Halocaridina rubra]|uniref:Uncharacterized protein n=1 Tax=Halocaridina rubra TaxID=373956 RepID=A0AAN9A475_HALRR